MPALLVSLAALLVGMTATETAEARLLQAEDLVKGPGVETVGLLRGRAVALAPGASVTVALPARRGPGDAVRLRARTARCGEDGLPALINTRRARLPTSYTTTTVSAPGHVLRLRVPEQGRGPRCRVLIDTIELVEQVPVGAALWTKHLDADPRYGATFTEHFDALTPENELKMAIVHPEPDRYDFSGADRLVDLASRHGKTVHGHVLIWGEHLPAWVDARDALGRTVWTRAGLREALRDHVRTLVTRYRGRIRDWDVVNEVIGIDGQLKRNRLFDLLGPTYIEDAFRAAHEADPEARLFINEKDADVSNARSAGLLQLADDLRRQGLRVDGVGLQSHLNLTVPPSRDELFENMKRFSDAGFAVRVSELDVTRAHLVNDEALRGRTYDDVAWACMQTATCEAVTVWGVGDRFSWHGAEDGALPFDGEFAAKPWWAPFRAQLRGATDALR